MNHGPLIFLGVFFSLALSWAGLILGPQLQLGGQQPVPTDTAGLYPTARSGLAKQGAEVYRANGCYHCHSQQVKQDGIEFGAQLTAIGDNTNAVIATLVKLGFAADTNAAKQALMKLPLSLRENVSLREAGFTVKQLGEPGGKAEVTFKNLGADLSRGWGDRLTVAQDYLFDEPVMLGAQRIGPDLANIGVRAPDKFAAAWKFPSTNTLAEVREWHFKHLADPRAVTPESTMPGYPWLFVKHGGQLVPTHEAEALVEYLLSLHSDVSLPNAPVPKIASAAPVAAATNAPAK